RVGELAVDERGQHARREELARLAADRVDGEDGEVGREAGQELAAVLLLVRGVGRAAREARQRGHAVEALLGEPAAGRVAARVLARARGVEPEQRARALDREVAAERE